MEVQIVKAIEALRNIEQNAKAAIGYLQLALAADGIDDARRDEELARAYKHTVTMPEAVSEVQRLIVRRKRADAKE